MNLFTSDRERRLWWWVLAVMVAIYASLGPSRIVAETLREHNLLRISVAVVLVLIGITIGWRWLRTLRGRGEIGVAIAVTFVYLWMLARIPHPEERTHLIEYGVVAVLIHKALTERRRHGRRIPVPALMAMGVTVALGLLDEGIQAVLPSRVFDLRDIGFNTLAAVVPILARLGFSRARRWDAVRRAKRPSR